MLLITWRPGGCMTRELKFRNVEAKKIIEYAPSNNIFKWRIVNLTFSPHYSCFYHSCDY